MESGGCLWGYVKIAGMIDESMDNEQMKQPPPLGVRSKPAWQQLSCRVIKHCSRLLST